MIAVAGVHAIPLFVVMARAASAARVALRPRTNCWMDPWPEKDPDDARKIVFDLSALGFRRLGIKFEQSSKGPIAELSFVSEDGHVFASAFGAMHKPDGEVVPLFYFFTAFEDDTLVLTWPGNHPREGDEKRIERSAGHHDPARMLQQHRELIAPSLASGRRPVPPTPAGRIDATHAYYRSPRPRATLARIAWDRVRANVLWAMAIASSFALLYVGLGRA